MNIKKLKYLIGTSVILTSQDFPEIDLVLFSLQDSCYVKVTLEVNLLEVNIELLEQKTCYIKNDRLLFQLKVFPEVDLNTIIIDWVSAVTRVSNDVFYTSQSPIKGELDFENQKITIFHEFCSETDLQELDIFIQTQILETEDFKLLVSGLPINETFKIDYSYIDTESNNWLNFTTSSNSLDISNLDRIPQNFTLEVRIQNLVSEVNITESVFIYDDLTTKSFVDYNPKITSLLQRGVFIAVNSQTYLSFEDISIVNQAFSLEWTLEFFEYVSIFS